MKLVEVGREDQKEISKRKVGSVSLPWGPQIPKYSLAGGGAFRIPHWGGAVTEDLGRKRKTLRAETGNHLAS